MGGGQCNLRLHRETVFVEGLAGDGGLNRNWDEPKAPGETASFSAVLGGGLDTAISRRFAFRVDGGYQHANFALVGNNNVPYRTPGLPNNFGRISSGLVWRF
jgi:hypothetical protein